MSSHSLLQGIILTQGLNLGLQHCRQIVYSWSSGNPKRDPEKALKGGRNVSNFLGLSDFPWGSSSSFPGLCFVGTQASVHFSPLLPLSRLHVPKDSRGMPHAELGCVFHSLHRRLLPREGTGWLLAHSPAQYQCLN